MLSVGRKCFLPLLFLWALLLLPVVAGAQSAYVSTGYEYMPYAHLKNAPSGSVLERGEIDQRKLFAQAVLPPTIRKSGDRVFVHTLYAERVTLTGRNFEPVDVESNNLIGIDYKLTWKERMNSVWSSEVEVVPGIYYDGHNANRDIYRVQATATFWRPINSHLNAGLGGGLIDEFGQPALVLIIDISLNKPPAGTDPLPGTHMLNI